jgi:hypothetical protein
MCKDRQEKCFTKVLKLGKAELDNTVKKQRVECLYRAIYGLHGVKMYRA